MPNPNSPPPSFFCYISYDSTLSYFYNYLDLVGIGGGVFEICFYFAAFNYFYFSRCIYYLFRASYFLSSSNYLI
jgi:hypothetical protein